MWNTHVEPNSDRLPTDVPRRLTSLQNSAIHLKVIGGGSEVSAYFIEVRQQKCLPTYVATFVAQPHDQ